MQKKKLDPSYNQIIMVCLDLVYLLAVSSFVPKLDNAVNSF